MLIETNQPKKPFVILALNMDYNDRIKGLESETVAALGRVYKPVSGAYKGQIKQSYLVDLSLDAGVNAERIDNNALSKVLSLAAEYDQESILLVDKTRVAYLVYIKGDRMVKLGKFTAVPKHEALASEAWTESGGRYYVYK